MRQRYAAAPQLPAPATHPDQSHLVTEDLPPQAAPLAPQGPKPLRHPRRVTVVTLNVRALARRGIPDEAKLHQLIQWSQQCGLALLLLQEARCCDCPLVALPDGSKQPERQSGTSRIDGWTLSYTNAAPHPNAPDGGPHGGVGILFGPCLTPHFISSTVLHQHIVVCDFLFATQVAHFVSCYIPHGYTRPQREYLYEIIRTYANSLPSSHALLVGGDFNDQWQTQPASLLTSMVRNMGLTRIPTPLGHHTFKNHLGASTIDHLIASNVAKKLAINAWVHPPNFPTDHKAILLITRLRPVPECGRPPKPDFRALRMNLELQAKFGNELAAAIGQHPTYTTLAQETRRLTAKYLGPKPRYTTAIRTTHPDLLACSSQQAIRNCASTVLAKIRHTITNIRAGDVARLCTVFSEQVRKDGLTAFAAIKALRRVKRSVGKVAASDPATRLDLIQKHCAAQLQNPINNDVTYDAHSETTSCDFPEGPFTSEELTAGLKYLKMNKAPGPDAVPAEVLTLPAIHQALLHILNNALASGATPEEFRTTSMAMIPKSGTDLSSAKGWRYIALMSVAAKLFDRLLLNRLYPIIEPHLDKSQNGFRAHRTTIHHVMALRLFIDEMRRRKQNACITFIDFSNAFPSITWKAIRAALVAWNVPPSLIHAVFSVYHNHKTFVTTPDGPTEPFSPSAGVLQGDTLAPFLFILVLNEILRKARKHELGIQLKAGFRQPGARRYTPAVFLTELCFADDIALLNRTTADATVALDAIAKEALLAGLAINISKTKFLLIDPTDATMLTTPVMLLGKPIEHVLSYKYLGVWHNVLQDLTVRTKQAWDTMQELNTVWRTKHLTIGHKVQLWRALVCPIMLYGSPTYPLTEKIRRALNGTFTRMLRRIHGLRYNAHATLEQLYGTAIPSGVLEVDGLDIPHATTQIITLQLNALTAEMPPQPLLDILEWIPHKRPLRNTLHATIEYHSGMPLHELLAERTDRKKLRSDIYTMAMQHDANVYRERTRRKYAADLRTFVLTVAAHSFPRLWPEDQIPLALQHNGKLWKTKSLLQFLKNVLPPEHYIHSWQPPEKKGSIPRPLREPMPLTTTACAEGLAKIHGGVPTGGYGCFYGHRDPRNRAVHKPGYTKHQAELAAIIDIMEHNQHGHLVISIGSAHSVKRQFTTFEDLYRRHLRHNDTTALLWKSYHALWQLRQHHSLHLTLLHETGKQMSTHRTCALALARFGVQNVPADDPHALEFLVNPGPHRLDTPEPPTATTAPPAPFVAESSPPPVTIHTETSLPTEASPEVSTVAPVRNSDCPAAYDLQAIGSLYSMETPRPPPTVCVLPKLPETMSLPSCGPTPLPLPQRICRPDRQTRLRIRLVLANIAKVTKCLRQPATCHRPRVRKVLTRIRTWRLSRRTRSPKSPPILKQGNRPFSGTRARRHIRPSRVQRQQATPKALTKTRSWRLARSALRASKVTIAPARPHRCTDAPKKRKARRQSRARTPEPAKCELSTIPPAVAATTQRASLFDAETLQRIRRCIPLPAKNAARKAAPRFKRASVANARKRRQRPRMHQKTATKRIQRTKESDAPQPPPSERAEHPQESKEAPEREAALPVEKKESGNPQPPPLERAEHPLGSKEAPEREAALPVQQSTCEVSPPPKSLICLDDPCASLSPDVVSTNKVTLSLDTLRRIRLIVPHVGMNGAKSAPRFQQASRKMERASRQLPFERRASTRARRKARLSATHACENPPFSQQAMITPDANSVSIARISVAEVVSEQCTLPPCTDPPALPGEPLATSLRNQLASLLDALCSSEHSSSSDGTPRLEVRSGATPQPEKHTEVLVRSHVTEGTPEQPAGENTALENQLTSATDASEAHTSQEAILQESSQPLADFSPTPEAYTEVAPEYAATPACSHGALCTTTSERAHEPSTPPEPPTPFGEDCPYGNQFQTTEQVVTKSLHEKAPSDANKSPEKQSKRPRENSAEPINHLRAFRRSRQSRQPAVPRKPLPKNLRTRRAKNYPSTSEITTVVPTDKPPPVALPPQDEKTLSSTDASSASSGPSIAPKKNSSDAPKKAKNVSSRKAQTAEPSAPKRRRTESAVKPKREREDHDRRGDELDCGRPKGRHRPEKSG